MKLIPYLIALAVGLQYSTTVMAADATNESASQTTATETTATEATTATEVTAPATTEAVSETTTAETDQPAMPDEQAGFSRGSVVRSVFTTAIQDREPIDKLEKSTETDHLFYFSELRDMSGQTAIHRWEHDGKVMAEVKFDVRGPRWRVWSSKSFVPGWAGDWKVSVLNGAGETISEELISMTEIPAEPAAATEAMPASDSSAAPADDAQPAAEEFQPPVNPELLQ